MTVSNERAGRLEAVRVVPYPEPGKWYLGFQAHCVERRANVTGPCPKSLEAAMVGLIALIAAEARFCSYSRNRIM